MSTGATSRSDRLLAALDGREAVIVTHDNPDPDAIAAGWALHRLARAAGMAAHLIGRGGIERAEFVYMIDVLSPPLTLTDNLPSGDVAVILVDCAPTTGNPLSNRTDLQPVAVIDRHETNGQRFRVRFRDVRPNLVATASISATYLREQGISPEPALATALLYAIRTETSGHGERLTRTDRGVINWLRRYADFAKLAAISNAPWTRLHYSDLHLALASAVVYEDTAVCFWPQASGSEMVGELADLLVRCEGVERVLCAARVGDDLILFARTTPAGGAAVEPLSKAIQELGHCGGHKRRAGGIIPGLSNLEIGRDTGNATLKDRWLSACHVEQRQGIRLVRPEALLEEL